MCGLVRKDLEKEGSMYAALFVLCLVVFGYLVYVLMKPEKF
ncbi:potassium-transporting ATPase subunit F [uncultured Parabacteroides sp.]